MTDSEDNSEEFEMTHKNKYQFADVINNDDSVTLVDVIGDSIQVGYPAVGNIDLEWVGEFLSRQGYAYVQTIQGNGNVIKDIFKPREQVEQQQEMNATGSNSAAMQELPELEID